MADWLAIEQLRTAPELDDDTPAGQAARDALGAAVSPLLGSTADGVIFDLRHPDSPIVLAGRDGEDDDPPPFDPQRVHPAAIAGHRAPHVWLADGTPLSDRFGDDWTLLDGGADPDARATVVDALRALPLTVLETADPAVRARYAATLTLIRPDRIVAWRGDRSPRDPAALAGVVSGRASSAPAARSASPAPSAPSAPPSAPSSSFLPSTEVLA